MFGVYANPNIHPYGEWERRRGTLEGWALSEDLRLLPAVPYDPREWLRAVSFREGERCRICYHMRLRQAALLAKRGRFGFFSTTLLYSKFQKHEWIREIGEALGSEIGVRFLYRDWRDGWKEGVEASRQAGMYRQQYCGCLYSEWERHRPRGERTG